MELDYQLHRKVFHPSVQRNETRAQLAANEGVKAKRCMQSLRTLWRSSKSRGHDDRVTHLKSFLMPSPQRQRHGNQEPLEDDHAVDPEGHVSDLDDAGDRDGEEHGDGSASESGGDRGDADSDQEERNDVSDNEGGEAEDEESDLNDHGSDGDVS